MTVDAGKEEQQYLWDHFKLNADQRLKAFNFFVVFSVFSIGGVLAAVERNAEPLMFVVIGIFICVVSTVFRLMDLRSQGLLKLSVPGLKEYEKRFPEHSRLFANDKAGFARYTVAFGILFDVQLIIGIAVTIHGLRPLWS